MIQRLIELDIAGLHALQAWIDPTSLVQVSGIQFFSDFHVFFMAGLLFLLWLYGVYTGEKKYKESALYAAVTIMFSLLAYFAINQSFPVRPRPEVVSAINPLIAHLPDNSFPSGHAIFAAAAFLAAVQFFESRILVSAVFAVGLLMVFCRIVAGIHYPGDMIVGALVGAAFAYLFYRVHRHRYVRSVCIDLPLRLAQYLRL